MDDANALWRNRELEKLISDLRAEAAAQKACITQYTFQAIGFTAIIWGLVFKSGAETNQSYLCGVMVVFLLMSVVRLANHKYATVNRNLGYELHLYRLKDYLRVGNKAWAERMLDIGWEEAMCAWRIVHPTIFRFLYSFLPAVLPYRLRSVHKGLEYKWYDTDSLLCRGATYQPGNYLRNVQRMLHFSTLFSLFTMWTCFILQLPTGNYGLKDFGICALLVAVSVLFTCRFVRERSYRKILESEFVSIQSSAVVWRLVTSAHILASEMALKKHGSYKYYTKYLSEIAVSITIHFGDVHAWLAHWENNASSEKIYTDLDRLDRDPTTNFSLSASRN